MRALHEDSTAARPYGNLSDKFSVTSGVRQGCVLAPTLFNFYLMLPYTWPRRSTVNRAEASGWPTCLMLIWLGTGGPESGDTGD